MKEKAIICITVFTLVAVAGCMSMAQKQQMFRNEMDYNIGRPFPEIPVPEPTTATSIGSGKSEYLIEYKNTGCKWIYIVDDVTQKVDGWRYADDPEKCYLELNWGGPW